MKDFNKRYSFHVTFRYSSSSGAEPGLIRDLVICQSALPHETVNWETPQRESEIRRDFFLEHREKP